jgi:hypothetical protein
MTPEQIQELLDKLFEIGGAAASKGFELAMRQVQVNAISTGLWMIFILALAVAAGLFAKRSFKSIKAKKAAYPNNRVDTSGDEFAVAWGLCGAAIGFILVPILGSSLIGYLMNPEWYAVKLLLEFVK